MKLKGRTALVTGGSRGIGRAVALALAEEGADVAINYVSSEAAAVDVAQNITKMGRRAILARADVSDYPDTFRMAQDVLAEFGQANYAASKAGVAAFTKSLAKELAGKGVTVNAVAPGFIETEMISGIPEKVRSRLLEQIPLRRFGTPEEVGRAVVYIVSSDGDYITGAELSINGGLLM